MSQVISTSEDDSSIPYFEYDEFGLEDINESNKIELATEDDFVIKKCSTDQQLKNHTILNLDSKNQYFKCKSGNDNYECKDCHFKTKYEWIFTKHCIKHNTEGKFICHLCNTTFQTESDLQDHSRKCKSQKSNKTGPDVTKTDYKCQFCDKTLSRKSLSRHIRTVHLNISSRANKLVKAVLHSSDKKNRKKREKSCGSNSTGANNIIEKKDANGHFICDVCKSSFLNKTDLDKHKLNHTSMKLDSKEKDERRENETENNPAPILIATNAVVLPPTKMGQSSLIIVNGAEGINTILNVNSAGQLSSTTSDKVNFLNQESASGISVKVASLNQESASATSDKVQFLNQKSASTTSDKVELLNQKSASMTSDKVEFLNQKSASATDDKVESLNQKSASATSEKVGSLNKESACTVTKADVDKNRREPAPPEFEFVSVPAESHNSNLLNEAGKKKGTQKKLKSEKSLKKCKKPVEKNKDKTDEITKALENNVELKYVITDNSKQLQYECRTCLFRTKFEWIFTDHMTYHIMKSTKEKEYKKPPPKKPELIYNCTICERKFALTTGLYAHLLMAHKVPKLHAKRIIREIKFSEKKTQKNEQSKRKTSSSDEQLKRQRICVGSASQSNSDALNLVKDEIDIVEEPLQDDNSLAKENTPNLKVYQSLKDVELDKTTNKERSINLEVNTKSTTNIEFEGDVDSNESLDNSDTLYVAEESLNIREVLNNTEQRQPLALENLEINTNDIKPSENNSSPKYSKNFENSKCKTESVQKNSSILTAKLRTCDKHNNQQCRVLDTIVIDDDEADLNPVDESKNKLVNTESRDDIQKPKLNEPPHAVEPDSETSGNEKLEVIEIEDDETDCLNGPNYAKQDEHRKHEANSCPPDLALSIRKNSKSVLKLNIDLSTASNTNINVVRTPDLMSGGRYVHISKPLVQFNQK